jgi:hypothetical protein
MITHWHTAAVLVSDRQHDLRVAADRSRPTRRLGPRRRKGRRSTG